MKTVMVAYKIHIGQIDSQNMAHFVTELFAKMLAPCILSSKKNDGLFDSLNLVHQHV